MGCAGKAPDLGRSSEVVFVPHTTQYMRRRVTLVCSQRTTGLTAYGLDRLRQCSSGILNPPAFSWLSPLSAGGAVAMLSMGGAATGNGLCATDLRRRLARAPRCLPSATPRCGNGGRQRKSSMTSHGPLQLRWRRRTMPPNKPGRRERHARCHLRRPSFILDPPPEVVPALLALGPIAGPPARREPW